MWLAEICDGRANAGLDGVELLQLDVVELESKCVEPMPKPSTDVDPPPNKQVFNEKFHLETVLAK